MNSIARRTRSQISGWKILPPAVACSRRKHAGVPYCSSSRKSKVTEEVILLSEEEEGSDHVGMFKTRKRGLNVWKGNTEDGHNGDEMRKFARKHGCSSSWKGRRQSEASSKGSRRIQRTKMKYRNPENMIFPSISGKGEKKGAIELMSSGDDNGSTEVEEPAKRPLIQVKKVKKIASGNLSRVGKRREKASQKFNYVKKKRNFQRRKDEDKESISTSDDVDNNVTDVDYVDDDEEDVNLKERSTSRLRSCQEGRDSKVMKGGTLHFFQRKKQKEIVDLVTSEDDDNTKQFKTKGKKTGFLGSQTGTRKTKENIPEKGRSSETIEESVGGRKDARLRDEENEGVSRNRVSREYANKRGSLGKKVKEEETQSLSFNIEEEEEGEEEEEEDDDDNDDDEDDDDYCVDDDHDDSEEDDDQEEYEEETHVENQEEQTRNLKKSSAVMKEGKFTLKNKNNVLPGRLRHDGCKKRGRQYNSTANKTSSHMENIPNIRYRKEDKGTFTELEANNHDQSTNVDDGYDDNDYVSDVKGAAVNVDKGIKEEVKGTPGYQKFNHETELNINKKGKKTSGQHMHDNEDNLDTNDYGNPTNGNCSGACNSSKEKSSMKKRNNPMDLSLFDLLMNTINEKRDTSTEDVKACEEKIPVKMKLPLRWSSGESEPEESDSESELEDLWKELNFAIRLNKIGCPDWHETQGESSTNMIESPSACQHQFLLDEQIGIVCDVCKFVKLEIKYVMPPMIKRMYEKSGKSVSREGDEISEVDGFKCQEFSTQGCNSKIFSAASGTVWDLIPDLKEKMFQHQKEGFEFIWKNLGGGIAIKDLKSSSLDDIGGCLISHAPGTGKTLLTIAFLRSFLLVFDDYKPMVVAPRILLSTWQNEFRKWGIGVPFHILNQNNFSGKENGSVLEIFWRNQSKLGRGRKQNLHRMVKIASWIRDKSILGISYNLFGKLTAENQHDREGESIRNLLLDYPGLLVLDEGHIARNKHSKLWQCLRLVKTQRRIMLSGTPFQNNFDQLFSTLYLIRPNFAEGIFDRFKDHKNCSDVAQTDDEYLLYKTNERVLRRSFATFSEGIEPEETSSQLKELRSIIDPFIHIREGTIHELPGLRDYFVYLYPSALQRRLLDKLPVRTNFEYDHKVSCICVHPSLLLRSSRKDNEKDQPIIQEHMLDLSKEQIHDGVKVRFVIELVQLCEAINEKILVFSQFIEPLLVIKKHLISFFGWTDGREVLRLDGSIIDQKQRQSLIHTFNDTSTEVKVLLVSTKLCAEGIDLTGASRVVLLDLVWNPSVRKQAISRAYRIGQRKVVYAYNLIASSTLEEKKHNIQDMKDRFSQLVFSASAKNSSGAKLVDMMKNYEDKVLFELIERDKNASMFQRVIELKYGQGQ